jgi:hypothetical protein
MKVYRDLKVRQVAQEQRNANLHLSATPLAVQKPLVEVFAHSHKNGQRTWCRLEW